MRNNNLSEEKSDLNTTQTRNNFEIKNTICVCSKKDLITWTIASRYISENLNSQSFVVIVPEEEIELFSEYSPKIFNVVSEERYVNSFSYKLKDKDFESKLHRLGWYKQQFIKMNALREAQGEDIFLIWDADTIPLKKLRFVRDQKIGHYRGSEHHQPYFDLIKATLSLEKVVNYSFVAQCLAVKGIWFSEFVRYVEDKHQLSWIDVFLNNIRYNLNSGFSEYETLGTFISHSFKDQIFPLQGRWLRHGTEAIGDVTKLEKIRSKIVVRPYDFVSFESSERYSLQKHIKYFLSSLLSR